MPAGWAAEVAAKALGAEITYVELDRAVDEPARIALLRDWVWARVYPHYLAERGLLATADEIAELTAYHREFERRDRLQRARKLAELNARLANENLDAGERAWLDEFRRVLVRMAAREAGSGDAAATDAGEPEPAASWIEFYKANRALYEEYGGTVALTTAGPAAHGARLALVAEYERRGLVQIFEPRLRRELIELMSRPPHTAVPPQKIDFTPYWRQPIPPSYFPE